MLPTTLVIVQPRPVPTPTNAQRWQAQQLNRQPFEVSRAYVAPRGTALFWYDPRTGQTLEIGTVLGEFTATAAFTLRAGGQQALLVPYLINNAYGLTAISDALVQRMHDAVYPEQVEAFVLLSEAVQPK
jgi:hypothetical protein